MDGQFLIKLNICLHYNLANLLPNIQEMKTWPSKGLNVKVAASKVIVNSKLKTAPRFVKNQWRNLLCD